MAVARSKQISRHLTITATQGSADAFVQGSVATGIISSDGIGLAVVEIDVFLSPVPTLSADSYMVWSLSRDTKTAAGTFSDEDIIFVDSETFCLTTSGTYQQSGLKRYPQIEGIILVEPTIYFQFDSDATGNTNGAVCRIYYEEVRLNETDILRILNNS